MGTFEQIAAALARALRPLTFALNSDGDTQNFVARIGWNLPSVPPSLISLRDALVQLHGSLADVTVAQSNADFGDGNPADVDSALGTLLADLAVAVDAVYQLPDHLRTELPPSFVSATNIDQQFVDRVFEWLVATDMAASNAVLYRLVRFAGVIEVTDQPEDAAHFQPAFELRRIHWERLPQLADPASLARDVYGWGTHAIDAERLFGEMVPLSFVLGVPAELRYATDAFGQRVAPGTDPAAAPSPQLWLPILQTDGFTLFVVVAAVPTVTSTEPQGLVFALVPSVGGDTTIPLGDGLELDVKGTAQIGTGAALIVRPDRAPSTVLDMDAPTGSALTSGTMSATLAWKSDDDAPPPNGVAAGGGTRATAKSLSLGFGAEATASDTDIFVEFAIADASLIVASPSDDGLLASVLPKDGLHAAFSLTVRWSRDGIRVQGSGGLALTLPIHVSIGPLSLQSIKLAIDTKDATTSASASLTGSIGLGPLTVTVQDIGLAFDLLIGRGNLGPIDVQVHFKRPSGAGLSIDTGVVSGAGFIGYDPATSRYSGMLQLKAGADIAITGVGVLDARLPGGAPGYALLVALRATFPAIEIGFGFALTSVGGLIALNRRTDVDALRARLASGTAGRILAPADPVRDAPALLADLDAVFPVAPGVIVVGPTAQLVWADLVNFDIGVFIELPGPTKIVLLGSAHASVESGGRAYLNIRVDIVGVVDLQQKLSAFDAVLVKSQLLEVLQLTGGAAFRLSWGDQPYAVLTLGGFHPAYNPEPLTFPSTLTRIAMVYGKPEDTLYLRYEGYFAVTSNTLQFGGSIQVVIHSGSFNIQGILGYDVLVARDPFHFEADFRASVKVRYKSQDLAGLTLTGSISGPGPVVVSAKVCIELLFFDICFSDTFRIGSSEPPPGAVVTSALDVLLEELDRSDALHADSTDRLVSLAAPPAGTTVTSPAGQLVWVQRQAPLGLLLQRIQGTPLATPQTVDATSGVAAIPELDWFAPGSFADLTDDQALTQRAFERLAGGLRFGAGAAADGPAQQRTLTIKQIRLPAKTQIIRTPTAFPVWVVGAGSASSTGQVAPAISVAEERWNVTDVVSGAVAIGLSSAQAHQLSKLAPRAAKRVATAEADVLGELAF